jgi:nucleoside-diphosphate-sugar epimerase
MMKNILIIGGSQNMGYKLVLRLLEAGHRVTVLNRGMRPDSLPAGVHRLRADRTDIQQMRRALLAKQFDVVVDFVMFNERDAQAAVELFANNTDRYIMISSGQVYLVREGIERPYKESEFAGRLLPAPKANTFAYEEWSYGMNKRLAEDVFINAHADSGFPFTSVRLPMVNSERDPFLRLYNYILRLKDGHPILIPETPNYPLRHVYANDVVQALFDMMENGTGIGRSYNLSQDESVTIDEFMALLAETMGLEAKLLRAKNSILEANGFLPYCSPFSERWMSELDNTLSKEELGVTYTPLPDYLQTLVAHYVKNKPTKPVGYKRRQAEIQFAQQQAEGI